jgi:hypothetical protein
MGRGDPAPGTVEDTSMTKTSPAILNGHLMPVTNGKISLARYAGKTMRRTDLVTDQQVKSIGHNATTVGFDVDMPDGSQMHIRLDRDAVEALARTIDDRLAEG